eukprot:TRINITY_DN77758_c0_g1_i1.p1 TRINITY_DN77758_c0_g1~~TRINITY_DN77758_c0_g1_i1.p1  ORF type:complete len:253 (+),score=40.69 TRINITY_DN77758_c0_g1_i1:66-824(+)
MDKTLDGDAVARLIRWLPPFAADGKPSAAEEIRQALERKFSECHAQWSAATTLPLPADFFAAWLCLAENAFVEAVMKGGLAADSQYTPASWLGGDDDSVVDKHAVWIAIGDGSGSQVGLWNQNWNAESDVPMLRVIFFDSEGCDNHCIGLDFKDFIRIIATLPVNPVKVCMSDATRYMGQSADSWQRCLDESTEENDEGTVAAIQAGHAELLRFLSEVWSTSPATTAEIQAWKLQWQPVEEEFEAFCNEFGE